MKTVGEFLQMLPEPYASAAILATSIVRTNESFLRRTHFAVAWHIFRDQLPEVVLECRFLRHVGRAGVILQKTSGSQSTESNHLSSSHTPTRFVDSSLMLQLGSWKKFSRA